MKLFQLPRGINLTTLCIAAALSSMHPAHAVEYEKEIRPILEAHCVKCHGPEKQKGEFRVDQRAVMLKGGDSGAASIVPGNPGLSHLLDLVKGTKPDEIMPPKGDPLTEDQIALLEKWISAGAVWPGQMDAVVKVTSDLWSLKPVVRPAVPEEEGAAGPVDAFILEKLRAAQLGLNAPAEPRALMRRVSILLTGLAPPPERMERFLADSRADANAAYSALIEELLASPHFGERWAQHWLDVIRWAESNGSEANLYRKNAWIFRDYVIRAFNEDKPYDQFLREQMAGDQMGVGEATGFLVAGPHVPASTVGQEPTAIRQARADRMDEIMQTVGASVLGMTVGCARCHNHKFDPISIQDYYSLTAVFQGVDFGGRLPEYTATHPRRKRAEEIVAQMEKERAALRAGAGQWIEDWGGFSEMRFPSTRTKALRIEFATPAVWVDELQVFGRPDFKRNFALAENGATLRTDEAMTQLRGELRKANDGLFGAQQWVAKAPQGSRLTPWVEIQFTGEQDVSRFRFSSNRESYFETDYLKGGGDGNLPGFRISALDGDGAWQEVAKTGWAAALLKKDPELEAASGRLHQHIRALTEEGPQHSFIARFATPAVTKVLSRGSPENAREEVVPAGFAILNGDLGLDSHASDAERRRCFAEWVTQPDQPLTARVMVNRVWHHLFGNGIVPTTADFGKAGAPPSHPELLDWLAAEFVQPTQPGGKPWSVKSLVRLIVSSQPFRQSGAPREDGLRADAALLWRFPPQRVEAEVIRDGILLASGKLDLTPGGRSYRIHNVKATYEQWIVTDNHGPETWRRMIYQERMRRVDDRMFTAFDFPDCGQVMAKRPVSTTPLQALNLMNSDFVVEQSKLIATRAREGSRDEAAAIRRAFQLLLTRDPADDELAACQQTTLELVCRSLINSNEYAFLP